MDWVDEYKNLRAEWRRSPILYAKQRLGLNPAWHQQQLLSAITEPGAKVSARSGHGTGKSAGMAVAIWWKLECFDYSKAPCTAPSAVQFFGSFTAPSSGGSMDISLGLVRMSLQELLRRS